MGEESAVTEGGQAESLNAELLYQKVCLAARHLDLFLWKENTHKEVFKPHVLALRGELQKVCIQLMFLHPVAYGRKAEELLWRKTYSDIAMLLLNSKHMATFQRWEGPLRAHLKAGLRFYEHLFLFLQGHYELRLQSYLDWPHCTMHSIGCKKVGPTSEEEAAWARMACHRCLLYLGDLFRYQNEFLALATEDLAERCYFKALSVAPHMGMPFNQLGALAGSKYYGVGATYFYQRCLHSEVPFKGAAWNLKRLYDHAGKRYSRLKRYQGKKLSPRQKQCWDNKRLLVSFLYLQSLLQPQRKVRAARLLALCQLVLEDFRLCLSYRPCLSDSSQAVPGGKPSRRGCVFLPDVLISHMVALCLMNVHSLKKTGSRRHRLAVIFILRLSSHLIQHVSTRIQARLQQGRQTPDTTGSGDGIQEMGTGEGQRDFPGPCPELPQSQPHQSLRWSCVSGKDSVSEVSFHSFSDSDSESDEEGGTLFNSQVHSEAWNETSSSDSTDDEGDDAPNSEARQEGMATARYKGAHLRSESKTCQSFTCLLDLLKMTVSASLPKPLGPKLQAKQGLPLAAAFGPCALRLLCEPGPVCHSTSEVKDDMSSGLETEPPAASCGGEKASISQGCYNRQIVQRKLSILSAEGLLPTIKVILSWFRTNHSLLPTCGQKLVSLWEHLCVLLNWLPSVGDLQEPDLGLSHYLHDLLQSRAVIEGLGSPCLPEDIALCQHSNPQVVQGRPGLEQEAPPLSRQEEAAVRICFLRSFGHFATKLPGQFLRYDPKLGIFVSTASEGLESSSHEIPARAPRITFSKDVVQLWLQREVRDLEKTPRSPQSQSVLAPYLFPDSQALCDHLPIIQQLVSSGKFFLIISKTVVDILYVQKREDHRASAVVTFLEDELKRGNQYILCQSFVSKRLVRPRMIKPDADAWDLYNILDFCKSLLDSSGAGTSDPSSLVTIITGICLDNPRNLSYPLQLVLGTATEAGVEIKNVQCFHRAWKAIS
ncbi:protein SMG5-like [Ochotona curzoniae]|uniref:protein SMG5-like n=1 Tax=Ochotona curzoniae TaxID=130825 RepID=UPI001B34D3A3|nr:protein SMG5-like [Ochotona curzoniae]